MGALSTFSCSSCRDSGKRHPSAATSDWRCLALPSHQAETALPVSGSVVPSQGHASGKQAQILDYLEGSNILGRITSGKVITPPFPGGHFHQRKAYIWLKSLKAAQPPLHAASPSRCGSVGSAMCLRILGFISEPFFVAQLGSKVHASGLKRADYPGV